MNRRDFLKLVGTASATLVAASCTVYNKNENVLPYIVPPDPEIIPGMPVFYKSTCTECPANCGMTVKAYDKVIDNRHTICPVKLEGTVGHPVNDGGLCIRGQSSLTRLYHPDRIKHPMVRDNSGKFQKISWEEAYKKITDALDESKKQGKKNVYLSGRTTGTISELADLFCQKLDLERLLEYEPLSYASIRTANKILFNRNEIPFYDIGNADFLLTLGADVVGTFVSPVSYGKQYAQALKKVDFNWVHLEPHVTLSGLSATNRIIIKPGSESYFLVYLLKKINHKNKLPDTIMASLPEIAVTDVTAKTGITAEQLEMIIKQLEKSVKPLLIAGEISTASTLGLETALLSGLLQWSCGMVGSTVDFSRSENYSRVGTYQDIQHISERLKKNEIGVMWISKTDPAANVSDFDKNIKNAAFRIGVNELFNDTLKECDLVLPSSHSLESWGDASPRKNVVSVIQPALVPIFDTRSEGDILLELIAKKDQSVAQNYQLYVMTKWKKSYGDTFTESFLKSGYHETPMVRDAVSISSAAAVSNLKSLKESTPVKTPALVIVPSLRMYDGRGKVLPLLSEIPDPLTTISYGDWISVSPITAKNMDLKDGDEVTLSVGSLKYPVKVQPELSPDVFIIQRGHIDTRLLDSSKNSGEDICILENVKIQKTGQFIEMAILSGSTSQEGRGIIPEPIDKKKHEEYNMKAGLYDEPDYPIYRWAMAIDLDSCTGCSACVAACYVENNVPIAGKNDHLHGREMSWIRIEPYYEKDTKDMVPMLCQQCDYAPCESVCPVYATYHNPEGLNAQVYNRCVGTRYCSNNCPYKVRRFNWFDYERPSPLDRMLNPEMSVRSRGVMEKCTFCVQRVRSAKDTAKDEKRPVQDGEVKTACAQTCPTNAITFGNLKDTNSLVYKAAHSEKAYRVLDYLGVEPAVYYLSKKNEVKK